jgi:hypothetical protein
MITRRLTDKQETQEKRGWIVYLLYLKKPNPFELNSLWSTLDQYNQPMGHRKFVEEIDYLRSLGMLRVFPAWAKTECSDVEQARLLQRFIEGSSAREMGTFVYARLTTAGINFQEGTSEVLGIDRIE